MGFRRIENMADRIVYVESMQDAVTALRARGLRASDARRFVDEALNTAEVQDLVVRVRRPEPADAYRLYALAGAIAAVTALFAALY